MMLGLLVGEPNKLERMDIWTSRSHQNCGEHAVNNELNLAPGKVLSNDQLSSIFKCSTTGGMRRSKKTKTLVIVSDHIKSLYDDRWLEDVLHYTGMGKVGPQSLTFMQNKTLNESNENGVGVHLFEVFTANQYVYVGRMLLAGEPYQEQQLDAKDNKRLVWMFPLRIVDGKQPNLSELVIQVLVEKKEKAARKLTDDELRKRVETAPAKAGSRKVVAIQPQRNEFVSELAKRRAKGNCQLCSKPAPFKKKDGFPCLESHHVIWISRGGDDTPENTVALCPNCHRKMHLLGHKADIVTLSLAALEPFVST